MGLAPLTQADFTEVIEIGRVLVDVTVSVKYANEAKQLPAEASYALMLK